MNPNLVQWQEDLHQRTLRLSREHRKLEWSILEVLSQVEKTKVYKILGYSSLFKYAVNGLGFSESVAYSFINVARKSVEIEALKTAIQKEKLSVAKASRLSSVLKIENASELIHFAQNHTTREIDFKVATLNPKSLQHERVKPVSGETVEIRLNLSKEDYQKLIRAKGLASKKSQQALGLGETLGILIEEYLKRQDPVVKARRIMARQKSSVQKNLKSNQQENSELLCLHKVQVTKSQFDKSGRVRLNAIQKHHVFNRDEGRCTFQDATGKRCSNEKWLHLHHIKPVHLGGSNAVENLTTLCSFHHDLTHQLSLPIEGQTNWLRSPSARYGYSCVTLAKPPIRTKST